MNTTNAKHMVACDECGASIGELYPENKNNISLPLKVNDPKSGDTSYNTHHFCDEACLMAHLNGRAEAKTVQASLNNVSPEGKVELDITSDAAYISTKDRNKLPAEHFLDPKRRSFPIRPGHECTDLSAALHRIGTYKGDMSTAELHAKILSGMKTHNCPLPASDK